MKKRILSLFAALLFLLPLLASSPIHGADSTSFDPTRVEVKAKGSGGVPVGMILAWPVGQNPEDMDNWLECNGQSISPSVYPELFAVVGGQVPNLRDRTVWGNGTNTVGTTLSAGLPNITGSAGSGNSTGGYRSPTGAFTSNGSCYSADARFQSPNVYMKFDASLSNSIYGKSTTVQPPARVVRFLIRARP